MSCWVLLTRGSDQAAELAEALAPRGIEVIAYPVLREAPCADPGAWREAGARLDDFRWLVLTSPRAAGALAALETDAATRSRLLRLPVAAVGGATADAARAAGCRVELIGAAGGGDLATLLSDRVAPGDAVLHLCGRDRRRELAEGLEQAGVHVTAVAVYTMEETPPASLPPLPEGTPAAVVLSSPRSAAAYLKATGGRFAASPHLAFGPTTARAAREAGLDVVTLRRPTSECIVEELCQICS